MFAVCAATLASPISFSGAPTAATASNTGEKIHLHFLPSLHVHVFLPSISIHVLRKRIPIPSLSLHFSFFIYFFLKYYNWILHNLGIAVITTENTERVIKYAIGANATKGGPPPRKPAVRRGSPPENAQSEGTSFSRM